jgi:uncharacterized protein YycO
MFAFKEELEKIADYPVYKDLENVEKKIKPGDILVTRPRPEFMKGKLLHKLVRPFLVGFQGTEFTHSGMHIGDGKVIDAGIWRGKPQVSTVPLKQYAKRYDFRVLRVKATPTEKKEAVEYAKDQVGKPFSMKKLLRLALPVSESRVNRERQSPDKLFCSELIANAYPSKYFAAHRNIEHVRPVDLQKSPLTRIVSEVSTSKP